MSDPITENPYELYERAEAEVDARNMDTAAALYAMAAEAFTTKAEPAMAAAALRNRAGALFNAGDAAASVIAYRDAAAAAGRVGDVPLRLDCRWGEADVLARLSDWPAVLATCEEILPLMRDYGLDDRLASTLLLRARAEYFLDDEAKALETARAAGEEFRRAANVAGLLWARDFEVNVLLFLGRTGEAVVTARDNHRVSTSLADDGAEPYHQGRLGEALLADGRAEAAVGAFAAAQELYRGLGLPERSAVAQIWLGRAYDALGRSEDAVSALSAAAAVLDAAGPRYSVERDRARRLFADVHFENEGDAEAIAGYRALLGPVLIGTEPPGWDDARSIERLTAALVRQEQPAAALEALAALRIDDGVDPLVDVVVQAGRCWARWHAEEPAAGAGAESLLRHEALGRAGLAQAWVMEMVGRHTGSVLHLARAVALYREHDDFGRSFALDQAILGHTGHLLPAGTEA